MPYVVDGRQRVAQEIGATGVEEILQNVRNILGTRRGTVPLDRNFGLRMVFLDRPEGEAKAMFRGEVVETLEKQEPRVQVLDVQFIARGEAAADGRLFPVVTVELAEGCDAA